MKHSFIIMPNWASGMRMAGMRHIRYVCADHLPGCMRSFQRWYSFIFKQTHLYWELYLIFCVGSTRRRAIFFAGGGVSLCACRYYCDELCVLVQEPASPSEPIHAMTCCTLHVLSWKHFTHLAPHPAPLASKFLLGSGGRGVKVLVCFQFDSHLPLQHLSLFICSACVNLLLGVLVTSQT